MNVWMRSQPLDVVSVISELANLKLIDTVGYSTVTNIGQTLSFATQKHVDVLAELWRRREAIRIIEEARESLENVKVKPSDTVETLERKILPVVTDSRGTNDFDKDHLPELVERIISPKVDDCIPTGFRDLDNVIGGYRPQEMIVIAGRPGMGKTAACVTMAYSLALRNMGSAFFSLDMGAPQLWRRFLAQMTGIPVNAMERNTPWTEEQKEQLRSAANMLREFPQWVDGSAYLTLSDIRSKARQMKTRHDIKVIFVDHIGKVRPDKANSREQEVSQIAQGLKALSKELDITVACMVQLNRLVEARADKVPMLSDLRESGSIEQEADIVLLNYRPEYYGFEEYKGHSSEGLAEIIAAKVRNGTTGSVLMTFEGPLTKLSDWQPRQQTIGFDDVDNFHLIGA